ncbi:hypothetical protein AXY43_19180 [Clostridium sp. MF28]|uniref:hypothetical protein n=1 Tax=Clostridium TaxID=1485 RepID=UPI000CF950EB|nr:MULTISPECIES: hypothetical protein [Clostridium]AVK49931.1 hypothetical protein AXY43_19180 [Clostridium sp. MF28]PSM59714.1 hypothetical protein C4L39_00635 [Clostridium diolis]
MIKNKMDEVLDGQISIFDLVLSEVKEPKKEYAPIVKSHKDKFTEIINLYKPNAARIVKRIYGALLVELEEKTLYFNGDGVKELELKKDIDLLPADEILFVNQDRKLNDVQLKKLKDMNITEYIKRKGDANIIIQKHDKTVVINPKGWILEYLQKPKYHEDEVYKIEIPKENIGLYILSAEKDIDEKKSNIKSSTFTHNLIDFEENDLVEIQYKGTRHIGKVVRIYNNGETLNVNWDGKQTAFYYKTVKKLKEIKMKNAM